jgi:uncharacterized protein (PEP-CTERM system associated)
MIITMVKACTPVRRARLRTPPRLAPLALAAISLGVAPASRAAWDLLPSIEVRETYTDNVALQPDALAQRQLVSEISPALALAIRGPRLSLRSLYRVQRFDFADTQVSGTTRSRSEARLTAHANVIDDLLTFDASGNKGQRPISPFGRRGTEVAYLTENTAMVSAYNLGPTLTHRFGASANLLMRYTLDGANIGMAGFGNRKASTAVINLDSGSAFRTLGWGLQANHQVQDDEGVGSMTSDTASAKLRYRATRTLDLTATAGYDSYDYQALGGVTKGPSWTAGFNWEPSSRTSLDMSVGHRFTGTTKYLKALHRSRRTVWNISYDDSITNTRSNFTLPAALDTAALLDGLFRADIPDPVQREAAIANYIARTGLPPTLADNVNFFSNRFYLQKNLTASMALKMARSNLLLTAFRNRRDALSVSQSDSQFLGNTNAANTSNVKQQGLSLVLSYQLSPRSDLQLNHTRSDSESLTTQAETHNKATRLTFQTRAGRYLRGTLELRHLSGAFGLASQSYKENAIVAALTYQR